MLIAPDQEGRASRRDQLSGRPLYVFDVAIAAELRAEE